MKDETDDYKKFYSKEGVQYKEFQYSHKLVTRDWLIRAFVKSCYFKVEKVLVKRKRKVLSTIHSAQRYICCFC